MGDLEKSVDDVYLFDPLLLTQIDWDSKKANFKNNVSIHNPGDDLVVRPLKISDYENGYMQLLSELTVIGDVDKETFTKRFNKMKECKNTYYIAVIEDKKLGQLVGTATLVIEQKFIHSASMRGRIEDVVVNSCCRGKQLGKLLVETMTLLGKSLGCYKMSLECKEENIVFYQSFGYKSDGQLFMVQKYKV